MKKWIVVDSCISKGSVEFHTPCDTKEEALALARREWNHLTDYGRKRRDAFFVGLYDWEQDEDTGAWGVTSDPYEIAEEWK